MLTQDRPDVGIFMPSLEAGGAQRIMITLAGWLAGHGYAVDLVVGNTAGRYRDEVPANVRIVDLGAGRVLTSLPGLVRYLRRRRPRAMLSAMKHANVIAVWAWRLSGVPACLAVSEHSHLSTAIHKSTQWRDRLFPLFIRATYRRADGIVAVSQGVADDLVRVTGLPRKRIEVIHNAFDIDAVAMRSRDAVAHPMLADDGRPLVLAVGRLVEAKDYPTLVRAFALLTKQRSAKLVILGEGPLRHQIENQITDLGVQDMVSLPGFTDNPIAWMRRASVVVLSSRREGFGNVLVEAMACGTPVVSTDCPSGPAEILENGKWGRLVPVGDAEALADAIAAALDDPSPPDVALRAVDFSIDKAAKAYLRALGLTYPAQRSAAVAAIDQLLDTGSV